MKRSADHILVTHAGTLPKPDTLREAQRSGRDELSTGQLLAEAVQKVVDKQLACGVDVINDGELSKSNFYNYVLDRMTGFRLREATPEEEETHIWSVVRREERLFGDYFRRKGGPFVRGRDPSPAGPARLGVCVGPLTYTGQAQLQRDVDNFKRALAGRSYVDAFLPAPSPGVLASTMKNEHYPTWEAFLYAIADALHEEYRAIVDAGFVLQVDSPDIATNWQRFPDMDVAAYRKHVQQLIEAINHALHGISAESVRFHMCWASWHGPHVTDLPLEEFVDLVLQVNASAISLEAANPRHQRDWRVWEKVKFPDGKVLVPGVAGHFSDFVEHPEFIAERLVQYAKLVGRENVAAGTDCGIARVGHPEVVWAKLQAMAEGARLADAALRG
ncbi:MAG: cobalamin-independent methionine synthase II family protein [Chloroflexota bacterium]|nr:cobalamin-independent methionine synthase II family protein [Chloroflexota bacterium]